MGIKVKQVGGEHDLFGDGSVVCIPTRWPYARPSIAEGARPSRAEIVITGDACYFCRTPAGERRLPRFVYDREQMLASLDRLESLEKGGARLFFGHDPRLLEGRPPGASSGVLCVVSGLQPSIGRSSAIVGRRAAVAGL